jgi:hypothetical protein
VEELIDHPVVVGHVDGRGGVVILEVPVTLRPDP